MRQTAQAVCRIAGRGMRPCCQMDWRGTVARPGREASVLDLTHILSLSPPIDRRRRRQCR